MLNIIKNIYSQMACKRADFALVTRLQWIEVPFSNEFLAYYKCLGIDHFYLINTEPKNNEAIASEVSSEFKCMVKLIEKHSEEGLNEYTNSAP